MLDLHPLAGAALLFDIDGTLCDSDVLHLAAFNSAFAPYGHQFDRARFSAELQGLANVAIAQRFLAPLPLVERERVMAQKEVAFREMAGQGLHPLPGLLALMAAADAASVPMAAVTNAPRLNADLMLQSLGLAHRFKAVVVAEELPRGKPDPLPYLEALRRLHADPALSLAFEDSRAGLASATAAGLPAMGMMTGLGDTALIAAGATLAASDYLDERLLSVVQRRLAGEPVKVS